MSTFPVELEAQLRATPDDRELYRVAGDWLAQHGRPEGELVALADALDREQLAWNNARYHAIGQRIDEIRRTLDRDHEPRKRRQWELDWRWGFVRRAYVRSAIDPAIPLEVLTSPIGRFARELVVIGPTERTAVLLDRLASTGALGSVRSLVIRADGDATTPVALDGLAAAMPELERLAVHAPAFGSLPAPRLRELAIRCDGVHQLGRVQAPLLHALRLELPTRIALAIDPAWFPSLRHLAVSAPLELARPDVGDAWLALPIAKQLDHLETNDGDQQWVGGRASRSRRVVHVDHGARLEHGEAMLFLTAGAAAGSVVFLDRRRHVLGCEPASSVVVWNTGNVQRTNGTLEWESDRWHYHDQGTRPERSIRINGRLVDSLPLCDGDELAIWNHTCLLVDRRITPRLAELCTRLGLAYDLLVAQFDRMEA